LPRPYLVGLTGSIGMGKSETLKIFASFGIPVHDSDAAVHALYAIGGAAVAVVEKEFPGTAKNGRVDRAALSRRVLGDADATRRLQALVHPLVAAERAKFIAEAQGSDIAVLDIPLLFEIGADKEMDAVVVASAPLQVQRERVLARPGMTAEKFAWLSARQISDAEKRAKADFVVETGNGLAQTRAEVEKILAEIRHRPAKV
jgi:dephospho-CoA kinase